MQGVDARRDRATCCQRREISGEGYGRMPLLRPDERRKYSEKKLLLVVNAHKHANKFACYLAMVLIKSLQIRN